MTFAYLACPYSDKRNWIRQDRFEYASAAAGILMEHYGITVFSPLTQGHGIVGCYRNAAEWDHATWMRHCKRMLQHAHAVYVLPLVGWGQSRGVAEELKLANAFDIPCFALTRKGPFASLPIQPISPAIYKLRKLQLWPN